VTVAARARESAQPLLLALGAAAAAVVVVATVDPNEPGHYPTCPFLALTGLYCPACGSLRAIHALARGEVGAALGFNLLLVLSVLPLTVMWAWRVRRRRAGGDRPSTRASSVLWALLVVACVFGVLRNLPIGAALAP